MPNGAVFGWACAIKGVEESPNRPAWQLLVPANHGLSFVSQHCQHQECITHFSTHQYLLPRKRFGRQHAVHADK